MQKFFRKWKIIDKFNSDNLFTVMSYNILAQSNTSNHFDQLCESVMNRQNRNNLIKQKIEFIQPDVCLLQEMDTPDLHQYQTFFEQFEMCNFFQKKFGDEKLDGTFIAFNKNKFQYISYNYFDCFFQSQKNYDQQDMLENEMWYSTNVQFLILKHFETSNKILFINSHLPYNRRKGHVKLAIIFLQNFDCVIWGGDFNTIPNSMLYTLITKGDFNLDTNLAEYSNLLYAQILKEKGLNLEDLLKECNKKWTQPLNIYDKKECINFQFLKQLLSLEINISKKQIIFENDKKIEEKMTKKDIQKILKETFKKNTFDSTYAKLNQKINKQKNSIQDIIFSQYTNKFIAPVDYLFFKGNNLKLKEVLQEPCLEQIKQLKSSLPCEYLGSDHITLAAKYKLNQLNQSFMKPYQSSF